MPRLPARSTATPWPAASPRRVASALSAHSLLGVTLAALLYIVSLSGVLAVFNDAFERFEQPGAPEMAAISPAAVQRAGERALAADPAPTAHFYVHLPQPDLPRTVVTTDHQAVFADAQGNLAGAESHPGTRFLLDLHYYLTFPGTLGMTVVGMLGALLLALSISGFLAHPRIFRDAFALRMSGGARLGWADIHNRLAVWTAPFHISNALSGAVIALTGAAALAFAALSYEDSEAVFAPVFGAEPAEDPAPAPLADIAGALTVMARDFPDVDPVYVILHEPGTRGQHLQILAEHPTRLIFGDYYNFDAEGRFIEPVGMADGTLGQQLIASAFRLHFGTFGGLPVKLAYALFGSILALIVAAGVNVYLARRADRRRPVSALARAWTGVLWGTFAALGLCLAAALALSWAGAALTALFWGSLAAAQLAAAFGLSEDRLRRGLQGVTAIALLLGLGVHAAANAGALNSPAFWAVGTALALIAALFALAAARSPRRRPPAPQPEDAPVQQPAE